MSNRYLLTLAICVLSACASSPIIESGKALVIGADTSSLRVMIRTIDDGEILWVGNYTLGTRALVQPGQRKINVMCEFRHSWGAELKPGNVTIDAVAGSTYDLSGSPSSDGKQCNVQVKARV